MSSPEPSPSGPIAVLHLVHWPRSGITTLLRNLVACSDPAEYRHSVLFLIGDPGEMRAFADQGCEATDLGYATSRAAALVRLRRAVRGHAGGVIHSHSFQPGFWGRLWYDRRRAGFVSTIHSAYPYFLGRTAADRLKSRLEQDSLRRTGHPVVAVSEAVRQHLLTHTRLDPASLRLVRNGIRTDLGSGSGGPPPPGTDGRFVLAVARLSHQKGIDVLLRAWPQVARSHPDLRLVIVGDGEDRGALEALAAELGVAAAVTFAGFQADVLPWLSRAAVFVNPSRWEGLPMGILEAQFAGAPLVVTDVGGVPEVVSDGQTGLLIPPEDAPALAAAIARVIEDPAGARERAAAARAQVLAHYDVRQTLAGYGEIYRRQLAGLPGPAAANRRR